jgi:hypothetical protein
MLTRQENARLLLLLSEYVAAVVSEAAGPNKSAIGQATRALERLLEYIDEIS